MTYSKKIIWKKTYAPQLIYKYLQKGVWKHPTLGLQCTRQKWWGVTKEEADRQGFYFFVLLKFCSILSRKTRKARKSSEFGIPNTISLDGHKVLVSCSLLTSQQVRTEQDNVNIKNTTNREETL